MQPLAVGKFLRYFAPNDLNNSTSYVKKEPPSTKEEAIIYGIVIIALCITKSTYLHHCNLIMTELGMQIRTAFCSLIYQKSLKLSHSALSEISVGKIVTLISKDFHSFDTATNLISNMLIGFVLIFLITYLIYVKVGAAAFAGICFLVAIIPMQCEYFNLVNDIILIILVFVGRLTSKLRTDSSKATDERLQTTQETLSAVKIIKMCVWEDIFRNKITKARHEEMNKIKKIYYCKVASLLVGDLVLNVTLYIIVMVYITRGNNLTAEVTFYILTCLQVLRASVTSAIPKGISQSAELAASFKRISKVLSAEEVQTPERYYDTPLIKFDNASVKIGDVKLLENVNFNIKSGFHLISGSIGSGKSSLLKAVLEDYSVTEGQVKVQGKISYASQEPWLFPSSIRQNILFGQDLDEQRYQKVVEVCALKMDIKIFDSGDNTIVDDRGMNLSKGQQARINLARAVYKDSDIYLLDDCLASLDSSVQNFIFTECIQKFLKNKVVLMVSHNEGHVQFADSVIFMENGSIKSCRKPSEVSQEEIHQMLQKEDLFSKAEETLEETIITNISEKEEDPLIQSHVKNIYHESKKEGKVDKLVYKRYFQYGGGILISIGIIILLVVAQAAMNYSEKLVSQW